MDKQRQNDQKEPIYNSSVPIQDIYRSVLAAGHDDDDNDEIALF